MKTFLSWSSGKDAAYALHLLQQTQPVECLVTTVNTAHQRVTMHGLREELLDQQSRQLGIPLHKILLPENPDMETYENELHRVYAELKQKGYGIAAYGDIFLEDLREYRDQQLKGMEIKTAYPLWKRNTRELLAEMIDYGIKAVIVAANDDMKDFLGHTLDRSFAKDLPKHVDPCGENGEFHTFCYESPDYSEPIRFTPGEVVYRTYPSPSGNSREVTGFYFMDLLPS